jgi:NTE family protein
VGLLSKLNTFSSVSGGSIANGLLAKVWPSLTKNGNGVFTNLVDAYEAPLRAFCGEDLRTGALVTTRLNPANWAALAGADHSVTDFLSHAYEDRLVGRLSLGDLAKIQADHGKRFIFCSSSLQTGVDFHFSGDGVGDWQIGQAEAPEVLVADAIAASSAFPIAFPPLVFRFDPSRFTRNSGRLADVDLKQQLRRRVVLSDGGVYDNLGLEPVWKDHGMVLCSDGGKPFAIAPDPGVSAVPRLLRAQDVIGNQALALRKRWLVASFQTGVYSGAYWGVGTEIDGYPQHGAGYRDLVLTRLRKVRTDLNVFSDSEQLVLMNHGWALADAAIRSYLPKDQLPASLPAGSVPDSALLNDAVAAAQALEKSDVTKLFG